MHDVVLYGYTHAISEQVSLGNGNSMAFLVLYELISPALFRAGLNCSVWHPIVQHNPA